MTEDLVRFVADFGAIIGVLLLVILVFELVDWILDRFG